MLSFYFPLSKKGNHSFPYSAFYTLVQGMFVAESSLLNPNFGVLYCKTELQEEIKKEQNF